MLSQVFCTVHRTRENGRKLARPAAGVAGNLTLSPHSIGSNPGSLWAQLLNEDGTPALPPLHRARVMRITEGVGIEIYGMEPLAKSTSIKSRVWWHEQVWWCKVGLHVGSQVHGGGAGAAEGVSEALDPWGISGTMFRHRYIACR